MHAIAYGVGVGPGDPELMTLKACRLIREADVVAVPGRVAQETVAYKIAVQAVPELAEKPLLPIPMPMTHDRAALERSHRAGAEAIAEHLRRGQSVVFLTLGDCTVYCTFSYLQKYLHEAGFETRLVSGIPSFCAAAARINQPLTVWQEELHVLPAVHDLEAPLPEKGTCVLMKSASKMAQVKQLLRESGREAILVENCGTADERVYWNVEDIPDDAGYYSLIISREKSYD